jgi:hypothetical protein
MDQRGRCNNSNPVDSDAHLGRLTPVRARAQPVADHPFVAGDRGLGPSPPGVAGGLLPGHASIRGNTLQTQVTLYGGARERLARYDPGARWHDDRCLRRTRINGGGNAFLVIGAVTVTEVKDPATWSSKGPTCAPSSASLTGTARSARRRHPVNWATPGAFHLPYTAPPAEHCLTKRSFSETSQHTAYEHFPNGSR